jgi:hypothetical protein
MFKFSLLVPDHFIGFTPIMIVGDDGGFADYIMWYAKNNVKHFNLRTLRVSCLSSQRRIIKSTRINTEEK